MSPPAGFGVVCVFIDSKPDRGIAGLNLLFHSPTLFSMASMFALTNSSILGW